MSNHELLHRIIQDTVIPGMTHEDRLRKRRLERAIVNVFSSDDTKPELAFTVLMNVLGYLIAGPLETDRTLYIAQAQAMLPLYVQAYREHEKKIG